MGKAMLIKLAQGKYIDSQDVVSINIVVAYEKPHSHEVIVWGKASGPIQVAQGSDIQARYFADDLAEQVNKANECQQSQ
jgi:hypothetical protein